AGWTALQKNSKGGPGRCQPLLRRSQGRTADPPPRPPLAYWCSCSFALLPGLAVGIGGGSHGLIGRRLGNPIRRRLGNHLNLFGRVVDIAFRHAPYTRQHTAVIYVNE